MAIQDTLHALELNDKEIKVYLTLLKHGKASPGKLSILTKINRGTVYNVTKSLITKGIVTADAASKTLYFVPLPPESLLQLTERPKRELAEKESLIMDAIVELKLLTTNKTYPVPKMQFIEEGSLKDFLYANITKWQQAAIESDGVIWGFQDDSFATEYEDWIKLGWQTTPSKHKKYQVRFLTNDSEFEQKMRKTVRNQRAIRSLNDVNFTATTWVAGDYYVMAVTKQHPFYLVEIHDATLAQNMKEVFRKLWNELE